jgi:uncharacterized protein (UPF0210 family)
MKIRTITTGFNLDEHFTDADFRTLATLTAQAKALFEKQGYDVQTIRMSTQPWENYASTRSDLRQYAKKMQRWTTGHHIDYFNLGPTKDPKKVSWSSEVIEHAPKGFCTTQICDTQEIFYDVAWETATLIKQLSTIEKNGFSNLRFAALCNIHANTPFYPASYHNGPPSFGIGFENSDLVYQTFQKARNLNEAQHHLKTIFEETYDDIEVIGSRFSKDETIAFDGIDVSISSSIDERESIAYAFEHLGLCTFGEPGTLLIARMITETLRCLPFKKTGYCGLMLPVLEDHGLATRNIQGHLSLTKLLLYSSVCGTGLDTIPLPGDIPVEKLYLILLDVASLSIKLQKPLSARLMPIPGKKIGDMTAFTFPYFMNSTIMSPD